MRVMTRALVLVGLAATIGILVGCEWSDGDSFNTSGGVNINFSGTYAGRLAGGIAVEGRNITRLVIAQSGGTLQVYDSNNSYYTGSIGSPNAIAQTSTGTIPAGTEIVQVQVNFSGRDETSGQEVQFVGTIRGVSVTDINGTRTESETTSSSTGSTNTTLTVGEEGDPFFSEETGETSTETETTTTYTDEFEITGANTGFILEGNWVEAGGAVSGVDAFSANGSGTLTITGGSDS